MRESGGAALTVLLVSLSDMPFLQSRRKDYPHLVGRLRLGDIGHGSIFCFL